MRTTNTEAVTWGHEHLSQPVFLQRVEGLKVDTACVTGAHAVSTTNTGFCEGVMVPDSFPEQTSCTRPFPVFRQLTYLGSLLQSSDAGLPTTA